MFELTELETYSKKLRTYITENSPDLGDGDSALTMLYETYADYNRMDDDIIKEDFRELYRKINGMTLSQMDTILDPLCVLCRDHQRSGFVEGIKIGMRLIDGLQ